MDLGNKEIDLLIADLIIRVSALERVMVNKNVCSSDDLTKEIKEISEGVIKFLEQKQINETKN
jgi:hypothetical protein